MQQSEAASADRNPPAKIHDCLTGAIITAYTLYYGIRSTFATMTIGELAKRAGVNVQTIRYYERVKLIPASHRWPGSGYRDFDEEELQRLRFIRSAKDLGFTLNEIRELIDLRILPGESCVEVKALLKSKRREVASRIVEMKQLQSALDKLIRGCSRRRNKATCPALWAIMDRAKTAGKR